MSLKTRSNLMAFRLKTLSAAIVSAMVFSTANAAGLGDLTVYSALGQPLRAEIELVSTSRGGEDTPLSVKLASHEAFRQANIEFNVALLSMQFVIEQRGDRQVVRVISTKPMNEPFIDMVLELNSGSSRVMREYVFLLDPASLQPVETSTVASPADAVTTKAVPSSTAVPSTVSGKSVHSDKPAPQNAQQPAQATRSIAAKPGKSNPASNGKPATGVAADSKPRLKLTAVEPVSRSDSDKAAIEDYKSMEKALADANTRVKQLEQKVGELQKLLEVTNSLLAELQKQNELAKGAAKSATAKMEPPAAGVSANPMAAAASATAVASTSQAPVASATAPATNPATASAPVATTPAAKPKPTPAVQPETSLLDEPLLLPGAGLALIALGAAGLYMRRRKAKQASTTGLFPHSKSNTIAGNTHTPDAGQSLMNSTYAFLGGNSSGDEVDALSEADVYIAYGRDVQAEEVLKEGLRAKPERHALRVKLLSIYAARKDAQAFEAMARELFGMTEGKGEEWAEAAEMGIAIDPANSLYASAKPAAQTVVIEMARAAPAEEAVPVALPSLPDPEPVQVPESQPEPELPVVIETVAVEEPQEVPVPSLPDITEEIVPVPVEPSSNDLDFDLDVLKLDEPAIPVAAEEPKNEAGPIDFEFLVPEIPVAEKPVEPETPPAAAEETSLEIGPIDFDFVSPKTSGKN